MGERRRVAASLATMAGALLVPLLAMLVGADRIPVAAAGPIDRGPSPTDAGQPTCAVTTTTTVQPGAFLLGEAVMVTRSVRAACPQPPEPIHVVLVLDGTASMAGEPAEALQVAMRRFLDDLEPHFEGDARVAVVSFAERARMVCPFTDRKSRALGCVQQVGAAGQSAVGDALVEGRRMIVAGRRQNPSTPPEDIREVMLLVTAADAEVECDEAARTAGWVSGQGTLLITVCVGEDCDRHCMRRLATSPRYATEARAIANLKGVIEQIAARFHLPLRGMSITETIPRHAAVVQEAVDPPPSMILDDPQRYVWQASWGLHDGLTVTYAIRPLAAGRQPLSDGAFGAYYEGAARGESTFDVPWVTVHEVRP